MHNTALWYHNCLLQEQLYALDSLMAQLPDYDEVFMAATRTMTLGEIYARLRPELPEFIRRSK